MAILSAPAPAGTGFSDTFSSLDLASRSTVIVAVSGGSDSTALLLLLKHHLDRGAAATRIVAVTIDHGLRPESAAEADIVARLCTRAGVDHRTVRWTGAKPATGLQAAARAARYRLLVDAASAESADVVLTGHTADDQAETVAMRTSRGDGRGLAGMAPATLLDGRVWLLRPLLGIRRDALRRFLGEAGESWIDDTSNGDRRFERVRLRVDGHAALPDLQAIARAGAHRHSMGAAAAAMIASLARLPAPGLVRVDPGLATEPHRDAAIYALRILLSQMGGTEQLPDIDRVENLFARLSGERFRATLSRAVVDCRREGIFLHRELRGLPASHSVAAGGIWDGRFRLESASGDAAVIAPAGLDDNPRRERSAAGMSRRLVRDACAGQPAVCGESSPHTVIPVLAPWARLLPSFDIKPARALADLVGAPPVPEPPFRGHIGRRA